MLTWLDLGDFIAAGTSPTSSISKAPLQKDIENGSCLGLSSEEYNREACLDASERESTVSITVFGASGDLAKKKIFPALFALYYEDCLPKISIFTLMFMYEVLKCSSQVYIVIEGQRASCSWKMYYLTLEANDCRSKKQYEAKVWVKPWMNFMELEDFKPLTDSPSTSSQDKKQLEQSSEGEKKESVGAPSENRILKQKKSKKEKSSKEQEEHDQNQEKGDIEAEVADASTVDVDRHQLAEMESHGGHSGGYADTVISESVACLYGYLVGLVPEILCTCDDGWCLRMPTYYCDTNV
ncbi:hypothetical protein ZIOFF_065636 [Zingiber officinale]|uniref:Cysteine proteinase inhibitor n=1 Tax=Zingiber officinale TaxID=94328 RepID=A0A8J5EXD0_ZINOF|nr:hypothetical protein ZIOFF_065636 [Zingiber officinale]